MSRKLDVAIAEALGYEVFWVGEGAQREPRYKSKKCNSWPSKPVRCYSTDGNDMLLLEEEMRERGYGVSISRHDEGGWKACWWKENDPFGMCEATTMPRAVALAAYRTLTGKEWTG